MKDYPSQISIDWDIIRGKCRLVRSSPLILANTISYVSASHINDEEVTDSWKKDYSNLEPSATDSQKRNNFLFI